MEKVNSDGIDPGLVERLEKVLEEQDPNGQRYTAIELASAIFKAQDRVLAVREMNEFMELITDCAAEAWNEWARTGNKPDIFEGSDDSYMLNTNFLVDLRDHPAFQAFLELSRDERTIEVPNPFARIGRAVGYSLPDIYGNRDSGNHRRNLHFRSLRMERPITHMVTGKFRMR